QHDTVSKCMRTAELLVELESQLPFRRFVHSLLREMHISVHIRRLSPVLEEQSASAQLRPLRRVLQQLMYYIDFPVIEHTGAALTSIDQTAQHCALVKKLQLSAFKFDSDALTVIATANVSKIGSREFLRTHLEALSASVCENLCRELDVYLPGGLDHSNWPGFVVDVLVEHHAAHKFSHIEFAEQPLLPNEHDIFDETLEVSRTSATQSSPFSSVLPLGGLALPRLGIQYLTMQDYLARCFKSFRMEACAQIRAQIEMAALRLSPRARFDTLPTIMFRGWDRMAAPASSATVVYTAPSRVGGSVSSSGKRYPSAVHVDVRVDLSRFPQHIRNEWNTDVHRNDVVFLLALSPPPQRLQSPEASKSKRQLSMAELGVQYVRGAIVVSIMDGSGKLIDSPDAILRAGNTRVYRVAIDPSQYLQDIDSYTSRSSDESEDSLYSAVNLLLRRLPEESNFVATLDAAQDMLLQTTVAQSTMLPSWLTPLLLGYGDPLDVHYSRLQQQSPVSEIDFHDTFVDFDHLVESFPSHTIHIISEDGQALSADAVAIKPQSPFILRFLPESTIEVRSYPSVNTGPYPSDVPLRNTVRFTAAQVEAIRSGCSRGLTLAVGPPGTGKSDTAVQIIANLYHSFPQQRTLLITHSNQALNQLFEKIANLDIEDRHLLRLGHGVEDLDTEESFSKSGRVASFLERRDRLLEQVAKLARSWELPGDHAYTCETSGYFWLTHVLTRWAPYLESISPPTDASAAQLDELRLIVVRDFPFYVYFADAVGTTERPLLFPFDADFQSTFEIAMGCFRHIHRIFAELEDILPFEILRSNKAREQYLLTKEARIVAMTCTHAALKRREFAKLGFHFHNVVIEEAAQSLEIETFTALVLQTGQSQQQLQQQQQQQQLQSAHNIERIVLIGDHNQLPPVVQSQVLRRHAHLDQSMFARFIRLGVKTIQLDRQGRTRPSIAQLFSWRYTNPPLGDLPIVSVGSFLNSNPGFLHDYQFINVGDYQGKGESSPAPHVFQNLGEAEYIVAVYQFMRLLGYPSDRIALLTTYNGQKALIRDVFAKRCNWNPYFGKPMTITTVDKFQGMQADYVLLSLVRTDPAQPGHIRDLRRMTVALSRARLGLYMFGRRAVFESGGMAESQQSIRRLMHPGDGSEAIDKLMLMQNETWPSHTSRSIENSQAFAVEDVQHMGKIVYEMSRTQLNQ
ncbi:P-loop containing nucleoside triphosphate hydrolase protein, partial [Ramicandelaber brevisporus]